MKKLFSNMNPKLKKGLVIGLAIVLVVAVYAIPKRAPTQPANTETMDTRKAAQELEEKTGLPVVTVVMDLATFDMDGGTDAFSKTFMTMPGYEKDFKVVVESIPNQATEGDMTLTRIRTELLAGKGPDLFICGQRMLSYKGYNLAKSLFQFPEQAMKNHLFLPLDEYMEDADWMEWESLQPVVMEAGRNEEGQQILPLTYTFTVTIFDKEYTPTARFPMTWKEMARDPDPMIRFAAATSRLADVIGKLADDSGDAPSFTEEELVEWAAIRQEAADSLPEEIKEADPGETMPLDRTELEWGGGEPYDLVWKDYTFVPVCNLEGGVTANIITFAAVNRNARHPDIAFKMIDHLLSPRVQQAGPLIQSRMEGMPVYVNTGDEMTPGSSAWRMSKGNFRQIHGIQEQINTARFAGPLDFCLNLVYGADEKTRKETSHKQYVEMKMYLGES